MDLNKNGVDIIIPVYNAYDDLKLCIDSIKRNTDLFNNRVILINDKSTDVRILPYLQTQQETNIVLIDSERNEGFSASINKGIMYSNRDVILLNSDTIVTSRWIEKIEACAYSQIEIGTVTPLSNSATLCSVPRFCEDNEIPENVSIDEFAKLIERCSLQEYPQITVAVGFCMFIKRDLIDCCGMFDSATFGKGYGEENDFCNRAIQYGYKHVMCDDTFIYHKGTVSFKNDEKLKLIKDHEDILYQRYSSLMQRNNEYIRDNPDQHIRDNINLYLRLKNNKRNLLYLIHSDFHKDANDNIGGTQLHVKDLVDGLKNIYNVFVIARDREYFRVTAYIGNESISFKYYIGRKQDYPIFRNSNHARIYENILNAFSINIVHIHHTFGLSLDMYYVAKKMNIPIVSTLHDYYYICPTIKLLNDENKVCIDCETNEMCRKCLRIHYNIAETVNYIPNWRVECEKALALCDKIIVPSKSAKNIYVKYYNRLADKIVVIEHGSDKLEQEKILGFQNVIISQNCKIHIENMFNNINNINGWAYIQDMDSSNTNIYIEIKDEQGNCEVFPTIKSHRIDVAGNNMLHIYSGFSCQVYKEHFKFGKLHIRIIVENEKQYTNGEYYEFYIPKIKHRDGLNVAFIGGLNIAKGSGIAYNIIKNEKKDINWYIFGGIADHKLLELKQDNLVKTGWYKRENLSVLIERFKIDVVCILPIWHETFCYTLSEALLCGVPVITTDMGAVGDRVKEMDCGWSFPLKTNYAEYFDLLRKINKNRDEYNLKLNNVRKLQLRNLNEMRDDYISLYTNIFNGNEAFSPYDTKYIFDGYLDANPSSNNKSTTYMSESIGRLYQVENELELIKMSTTYKLAIKLRQLKMPFKHQMRNILLKIYRSTKK